MKSIIVNVNNGKVRFLTQVMKIVSEHFWLVSGSGNSSGFGALKWFDTGRFSDYLRFFVSQISCVDAEYLAQA